MRLGNNRAMVNLVKDVKSIRRLMCDSGDLVVREIPGAGVAAVYFDGMLNLEGLERSVVEPIVRSGGSFERTEEGVRNLLYTGVTLRPETALADTVVDVASGECLLLIEGCEKYFVLMLRKLPVRPVAEPPTSAVLKGPREGFVEDIKTNMVLLRKRFHSGKLVFETAKIGRFTDTAIAIGYVKGIADETLVKTVKAKISAVDVDGIIDSSYVAKLLEGRRYSVFRQTGTAEKPDIVAAKLLEGRIVILVDGSPIALTLPFLLLEDFQDTQDYFKRATRASVLRIMRLIAVFFAVFLPAAFVALQSYQFQILPLKLLITVLNSIKGIPFSPILEMLIALLLFDVLNEASVRMPRYVGMAISVVGAIILGDTAVQAGLLSSLTVLITALSGIGLYAIPDEVGTFSVIRLFLVIVAGTSGLFGIVVGAVALAAYLVSLEVFGVAYLAPFAPLTVSDLKDSVIKLEQPDLKTRPASLGIRNRTRQK